ncbi:MAG: hypothetical protein R3C49_26300 [Planctomycetaceae bacterium]
MLKKLIMLAILAASERLPQNAPLKRLTQISQPTGGDSHHYPYVYYPHSFSEAGSVRRHVPQMARQ